MSDQSRNHAVDVFRAVAIFIITGAHVLVYVNHPSRVELCWNLFGPFLNGNVGTSLFIFISGYLMQLTSARRSVREFIRKRLLRLVGPYYIALLIWNLFLQYDVLTGSHSWFDNITHILFIHTFFPETFFSISGVFWYLGVQIHLFILYFLLRRFIPEKGGIVGSIFAGILVGTSLFLPHFVSEQSPAYHVFGKSILTFGFSFFMGVVMAEQRERLIPILKKLFWALLPVAVGGLFLDGITMKSASYLEPVIKGVMLGLVMLGMPAISDQNFFWRPWVTIGRASYSIYLYNYIFMTFEPTVSYTAGFVLYSCITIAVGVAAYYLIEKPLTPQNS